MNIFNRLYQQKKEFKNSKIN